MNGPRVLAVVLAGGAGKRLMPLTRGRAKPAVSFGGGYRLVDFALSNLVHARIDDVWIVEQHLPHSLNDHLANGRPWDLDRLNGGLKVLSPYTGGDSDDEGFAAGNAEALARNSDLIREFNPDLVLTLSADHIVKLDIAGLIESHQRLGGTVTLATTHLKDEDLSRYAVVGGPGDRIDRFDYKPETPQGDEVAIEAFVYSADRLLAFLDGHRADELEDYGDQLLPELVAEGGARRFPHEGYWRDVGTIESYYRGQMDLLDIASDLLMNPKWPILTHPGDAIGSVIAESGIVRGSIIGPGAQIEGEVINSVVARGAKIEAGAHVKDAVILPYAVVSSGVRVERAIVDEWYRLEGDCVGDDGEIAIATDEPSEEDQALEGGERRRSDGESASASPR